MSDFKLTDENYYSIEADQEYCSSSQLKSFKQCEARTMAMLNGEYVPEKTEALLIGSLVDSLYENDGDITPFTKEYPECFSTRGATKGQLKSTYKKGVDCYERSKSDELFSQFMSGEHQSIFVGEIDGLPFKAKLDSYHKGRCIVDLKTCKSIRQPFFEADSGYVSFIEKYGYTEQLAIYQELVYQNTGEKLPCFIAAVSKEDEPDIELIYIDDEKLKESLIAIKQMIPSIKMLKSGEVEPIRCECCAYCRRTRKLEKPIHYSEILLDGTK